MADILQSLGPWSWLVLGLMLMGLELVAPGVFLIWLGSLTNYYAYTMYYRNRAWLTLLLALCIGALMLAAWYGRLSATGALTNIDAAALLVPFLAAAAGDLWGSARWLAHEQTFCKVLADPARARDGVEQLKQSGSLMGWSWTHPTMSVLLRRQGSDAMVLNEPGTRWQPFSKCHWSSGSQPGCRKSARHCRFPTWRCR